MSDGRRNRIYARTSLYSVILLFSAVPRAGTISTSALKSRTASNCRVTLSNSVCRSAVSSVWAALAPLRAMRRRRAKHDEKPTASRQTKTRQIGTRRNGIILIVGSGQTRLSIRTPAGGCVIFSYGPVAWGAFLKAWLSEDVLAQGRVFSIRGIPVCRKDGPVAQLGARFHGMEEVDGSNPSRSTIPFNSLRRVVTSPFPHYSRTSTREASAAECPAPPFRAVKHRATCSPSWSPASCDRPEPYLRIRLRHPAPAVLSGSSAGRSATRTP